jgi:5-amino-6-(5-phosphoribosylamino)uracil reductase
LLHIDPRIKNQENMVQNLPHTTVILAMSADGKIADFRRSPARFGSKADQAHLEKQIAATDAVLFGASTLRAYGTTLTVRNSTLMQQRKEKNQPPQPFHIVISRSGKLNPDIRFFQQPIERWLLTTNLGATFWEQRPEFAQILVWETPGGEIDLATAWKNLANLGINHLGVLGGSQLVSSLLESDLIDEFWFTICPLILGSDIAPSPVRGKGFLADLAPQLLLLEVSRIEQEVFLHYQIQRKIT